MKDNWVKKGLVVSVILLFVGVGIIPSIAQDAEKPLPTSKGNWLYVGGSGPGNYTRIQDAIDNASDGDTVFVYDDSSPYNGGISPYSGGIIVDKSITVQGENMYTTVIINGGFSIVGIDHVVITGFTIKEANYGVWLENSSNNIIEDCVFYQNAIGLELSHRGEKNNIRNCSFNSNLWIGAWLNGFQVNNNEISYCDIFDNGYDFNPYISKGGIVIEPSHGTKIHHCNINNNINRGVKLFYCAAQITSNNIINNTNGVVFMTRFPLLCDARHNWWGTPQGPNINIEIFYFGSVAIQKVNNSDTVLFYGWRALFLGLTRLLPWLSEPVPDAGRQK